jgi:orotate phosphoribosyltransferase
MNKTEKENKEISLQISEYLLQIKAIKLNISKPFTWASGWKSPIYCDNRKILSFPKVRTFVRQELAKRINDEYGTTDVIAGVATGGIAIGALVAQDLGLPFVYVRASEKQHGLNNQIEGVVKPNQSVVVIEDLISTGRTSLEVVKVLKDAGCKIQGMIAIFTYGFKIAEENFKKAKCPLNTLLDYDILIQQAVDSDYIRESDLLSLVKWRDNPEDWKNKIESKKQNNND